MNNSCIICKKIINEKPWMSLTFKHENNNQIHCCSYICSKGIKKIVGGRYLHLILNKEDFDFPIPMIYHKKDVHIIENDADREELMNEINKEERIREQEEEYYENESDYSSEEFYE